MESPNKKHCDGADVEPVRKPCEDYGTGTADTIDNSLIQELGYTQSYKHVLGGVGTFALVVSIASYVVAVHPPFQILRI